MSIFGARRRKAGIEVVPQGWATYFRDGSLPAVVDEDMQEALLGLEGRVLTAAQQWAQHRETVLAAWIEQRPGKRPFGWWQYDRQVWRCVSVRDEGLCPVGTRRPPDDCSCEGTPRPRARIVRPKRALHLEAVVLYDGGALTAEELTRFTPEWRERQGEYLDVDPRQALFCGDRPMTRDGRHVDGDGRQVRGR